MCLTATSLQDSLKLFNMIYLQVQNSFVWAKLEFYNITAAVTIIILINFLCNFLRKADQPDLGPLLQGEHLEEGVGGGEEVPDAHLVGVPLTQPVYIQQ